MIDQDDARFSSFTRDLARRHRRPRSYPPPPARADVLEQLCGGSIVPPSGASFPSLPSVPSLASLASFLNESDDSDADRSSYDAGLGLEDEPS